MRAVVSVNAILAVVGAVISGVWLMGWLKRRKEGNGERRTERGMRRREVRIALDE